MTKKTLAFLIVASACIGFARSSDAPAESLALTAVGPPEIIALTGVPAPALTALGLEEPVFAAQASIPVMNPLGGFKPAGNPGKALFDLNLVAMVALNIADYASTREALNYPGLRESNPLMTPFAKSPVAFAAVKIGTTALTYWCMKALFKKNKTVAWVLTTASNVFLSYAVANNLQMIQRARAR
jgi:hypothetical protein